MSSQIHPSAVISPKATIGSDCHIGAFCIIGDEVTLGDRVHLDSHVVVDGRTIIGDETHVFPFVSIGLPPQDLKYAGEPTAVEIGKRNQIREFVTDPPRNRRRRRLTTRIGDGNLLMAQAHVAHDCQLGNEIIMANAATLAGHVEISDKASVGAYSGVHQFCRIGYEAFVGGYSVVVKDAMPFAIIQGNHANVMALTGSGMKRRRIFKGHDRKTQSRLSLCCCRPN